MIPLEQVSRTQILRINHWSTRNIPIPSHWNLLILIPLVIPMGRKNPEPRYFFTSSNQSTGLPGLVNVYKKRTGKIHHAFLMGKSTISITIFNSFFYVYQMVYLCASAKFYQNLP